MLTIAYRDLSTKVLGNLADRTIELASQTANADITNHPLFAELKNRSQEYNAIVIKKTFSGMGLTIEEADLKRDNCDLSFKRILHGMAAFQNTPQAEAAASLLKIYEETGNVYHKNYAEESVILDRRIERLSQPDNTARIAQLNLTGQFTALRDAQTEFNRLYIAQAQANSALRQQNAASSIRQYLEDALRNFYGWINVLRGITPYDTLCTDIAEVIKAAKLSARAQSKESTTADTGEK